MNTAPQPRLVTGYLTEVHPGYRPFVAFQGNDKDHVAGIRLHQVAGCQALMGKPCCARVTEDEEGFTVLIDIWPEDEPPPWERDPIGDAAMMEWWGLGRRLA